MLHPDLLEAWLSTRIRLLLLEQAFQGAALEECKEKECTKKGFKEQAPLRKNACLGLVHIQDFLAKRVHIIATSSGQDGGAHKSARKK